MNITLTKQQEKLIRNKMTSGIYESEQDAVDAGLNLLALYEENLHQSIVASLEEVEQGHSRLFDKTVVEDLKAALQKRLDKRTA